MDNERVNVLEGIARRDEPAVQITPRSSMQRVNATFRVDPLALSHARGRAVVEWTSVNALIDRLLAEYSGIYPPPEPPAPPPRKRVRITENSYR